MVHILIFKNVVRVSIVWIQMIRRSMNVEHCPICCSPSLVGGDKQNGGLWDLARPSNMHNAKGRSKDGG